MRIPVMLKYPRGIQLKGIEPPAYQAENLMKKVSPV